MHVKHEGFYAPLSMLLEMLAGLEGLDAFRNDSKLVVGRRWQEEWIPATFVGNRASADTCSGIGPVNTYYDKGNSRWVGSMRTAVRSGHPPGNTSSLPLAVASAASFFMSKPWPRSYEIIEGGRPRMADPPTGLIGRPVHRPRSQEQMAMGRLKRDFIENLSRHARTCREVCEIPFETVEGDQFFEGPWQEELPKMWSLPNQTGIWF